MSNEREKVASKVQKLMALGTSCNQKEAELALARAGKLMEEWGLTISDIELNDQKIVHEIIDTGSLKKPALGGLPSALGEWLGVKIWIGLPNRRWKITAKVNILGYSEDVEMFKFFWEMLNNTFEREWRNFQQTPEYRNAQAIEGHGRKVRTSFQSGFVNTLYWKLSEMADDARQFKTSTGTELIPLKMANVEEFFENEMGLTLTRGRAGRARAGAGYANGASAGSRVGFNTPVSGGSETKLITG